MGAPEIEAFLTHRAVQGHVSASSQRQGFPALLFLYQLLGQNIVLTIVVFTVLIRLATYPLTLQQIKSSKAMQELQPKMKRI